MNMVDFSIHFGFLYLFSKMLYKALHRDFVYHLLGEFQGSLYCDAVLN